MPANIVVPEVGESIVDARISKWLRKEGDRVSAGEPLVELETDKIDLEVPAPAAGVLSRIDRKDGDDVKVGEVLGVIDEAAEGAVRQGRATGGERGNACRRRGQERQGTRHTNREEGGRAERRRYLARAGDRRCRPGDEARRRAGRRIGRAT